MEKYILTGVCLLAIFLYYKFVFVPENKVKQHLKKAGKPNDYANAQDDDFCNILSAINNCKTYPQFEKCVKAIYRFQLKYGETITGKMDVTQLLNFYEEKQAKQLPQLA